MLYFNAPLCKSVAKRVGRFFLTIFDKNFTKDHNIVKLSTGKLLKYRTPNMRQQIMAHS